MSVATRNPFALLDDETSRPSTPPVQAPKAEPAAAAQPTRGGQRGRGGARGGRYYQRGGARSGAPAGDSGDAPAADDAAGEGNKKRFDGEGRGRGRGRGRGDRGRGGRGGRLDRHSATGKTDSDKKVHQGWGGDEGGSELKAEAGGATDAAAEATGADAWGTGPVDPADAWGSGETPAAEGETALTPAEGEKPAEGRRGRDREPEEEDNTLTLDQYIKQQKEKELELVPKLEARKANEGDDSIWKDAVAITKKDEEEDAYFVGKTQAKTAPKSRAKKEEKVFLEIDARFERPRGGRGGRGGPDRGDRGRGGRGRGSGRGRANGNTAPALNVDDQTAFPSLA